MKKSILLPVVLALAMVLSACGAVRQEAETDREQITQEGAESMKMTIGDTPVTVAWEDNASVEALKALCAGQPLKIELHMYGGFEQVGDIGSALPRDDEQTTSPLWNHGQHETIRSVFHPLE